MGNSGSSSHAGNVHWHPTESATCCMVIRIRHVPGLPLGAADILARWVQHGTVAHPHRNAMQHALETAGATLRHSVSLEHTTFTLVSASWTWAQQFVVQLLRHPLLEDDAFEELDMQWAEAWKRKPFPTWLAQQLPL